MDDDGEENINATQRCSICGSEFNITKEHIPPKSVGNNSSCSVFLPKFDNPNKLEFMKKEFEDGFYIKSLCARCNNKTGRKYVIEFKNFTSQLVPKCYDINGNLMFKLFNIYPLKILKQIYTMFLSVSDFNSHFINLQDDIIDTKRKILQLPFRVFMYYNCSKTGRIVPFVGRVSFKDHDHLLFSEISYPPFGFILADNQSEDMKKMFEISNFNTYDYETKTDLILSLPSLSIQSATPMGFGLAKKVEKEMNDNLYGYFSYNSYSTIIEKRGGKAPL